MKTFNLNLPQFHYEEHYRFHSTMIELVEKNGTDKLGAGSIYSDYSSLLLLENEALAQTKLQQTCRQLADADFKRDLVFQGLKQVITAYTQHFDPDKKAAAQRISKLILRCHNAAQKGYNDETQAITKLINSATDTHTHEFTLLQLNDWLDQLTLSNNHFDHIYNTCLQSTSSPSDIRIKQVRPLLDTSFYALIDRINALVLLNGPVKYLPLMNEMKHSIHQFEHQTFISLSSYQTMPSA